VIIRYPVELDKSAEIDDRIARELLDVTKHDPKLKVIGSETPTIEPAEMPAEVDPAKKS